LATALRLRRLFLKSEIFLRHHLLDNLEKQDAEMAIANDNDRLDEILEDFISVREAEINERESSIPDKQEEFISDQPSQDSHTKTDPDVMDQQSTGGEDTETEDVYYETEYLLTEDIPITIDSEQNLTSICLKDIGVIDLKKTTFKFIVDEEQRGTVSRTPRIIKKKSDSAGVKVEQDVIAENLKSFIPEATLEISLEVLKLACCMCKHISLSDEDLMEHIKIHRIRDSRAAYDDLWGDVAAQENKGKNERSKCQMCLKTFVSPKAMLRHRKMRYYEKKFQCEHCGASFGINELLRKHMAKVHLTDGKAQNEKVQCKICAKMITKVNIKFHEQNHLDKDKYTCKMCDKKFSSIKYMKQHALTHSSLKFCACQLCGKQFKFKVSGNLWIVVFSKKTYWIFSLQKGKSYGSFASS
jgi:DNA-directed RNA polymerase subunit M/transcription elongation factor TFIIS